MCVFVQDVLNIKMIMEVHRGSGGLDLDGGRDLHLFLRAAMLRTKKDALFY